jgi:hypothetical protein
VNWRYSLDRIMRNMGRKPQGGWRIENPYSFLDNFDMWFRYECFMVGFEDHPPEAVA